MSGYRLHARKIVGGLAEPAHDETRIVRGRDLTRLTGEATRLRREGFTVWIYEGEGRAAVSVPVEQPGT